MSHHRVWLPVFPDRPGDRVVVGGEEAHHAIRVKRLEAGDGVELLNGQGKVARTVVRETRKTSRHGWELECEIVAVDEAAKAVPAIEVWSAVPKGDRLEQMIDGLAQAGVQAWAPLLCERSVVEPREGKIGRLERVVEEACKQSGRAWSLEIQHGGTMEDAIGSGGTGSGPEILVADGSGEPYAACGMPAIRLLVGPEGGWTPQELELARRAGARIASFGRHTLRIETAAVIAAAVVGHIERLGRDGKATER